MESQPKVIREIANTWFVTGLLFGILLPFLPLMTSSRGNASSPSTVVWISIIGTSISIGFVVLGYGLYKLKRWAYYPTLFLINFHSWTALTKNGKRFREKSVAKTFGINTDDV